MKIELKKKLNNAYSIIRQYKTAVVCYSGGVDSTLVCYLAHEILKENCVAMTGVSPSHPTWEIKDAKKYAAQIGIKLILQKTNEFNNPDYLKNSQQRCFFCKKTLCNTAYNLQKSLDFQAIFDGSIADDANDFRPGIRAKKEAGIVSPLSEANINKKEVRELLKIFNLDIADNPSHACLASRIAYNIPISIQLIKKIDKLESIIHNAGIKSCRVRVHEHGLLRIEVPSNNIKNISKDPLKTEITTLALKLGFSFVTCDLEGFESGKMNRIINA